MGRFIFDVTSSQKHEVEDMLNPVTLSGVKESDKMLKPVTEVKASRHTNQTENRDKAESLGGPTRAKQAASLAQSSHPVRGEGERS